MRRNFDGKIDTASGSNRLNLLIWSQPSYCTHSLTHKCTCGFTVKVPTHYPCNVKLPRDHWHCLFTWIFKYKHSQLRCAQAIYFINLISSNDAISSGISQSLILKRNTNVPSTLFSLPEDVCLKFSTFDESSIIDFSWNGRLTKILNIRMATCEILAALSTLGGAFSCLGESGDLTAAQTAGCIALHQLILSRRIEDPNLILRCYIYQVYSLCQQGLRVKAIKLIKEIIYPNLQRLVNQHKIETPVKNMYIAACHKVRQMHNAKNSTRKKTN